MFKRVNMYNKCIEAVVLKGVTLTGRLSFTGKNFWYVEEREIFQLKYVLAAAVKQ